MSKIAVLIFTVLVALAVGKPADDALAADPELPEETTKPPLPEFSERCIYDFKGNRITNRCNAQTPPKCEGGNAVELVQTLVGTEYELCCCNF
jgi:hypothetical protein